MYCVSIGSLVHPAGLMESMVNWDLFLTFARGFRPVRLFSYISRSCFSVYQNLFLRIKNQTYSHPRRAGVSNPILNNENLSSFTFLFAPLQALHPGIFYLRGLRGNIRA